MLYRHKPEEGRNARQTAFWLGEGMIFFACYSLSGTLESWKSLRAPLFGDTPIQIPLLGIELTGAFVAATIAFFAMSFFFLRYLAAEKIADHLIEVESEMNKVTWPSFEEATNSSIIVIITVLILMGFLALSDFVLSQVFELILWGGINGT
ncbi:MAG: preprotein translocase subunit SecE [Planctomycetes bacterium]|nr:preprotein translocase subunit SecE [Planctomycetota bacterium]MCP4770321.1 preprotein translocase subunit SecE [Planctomycetota bacterium]MCP4861495.1 preprotein translocase subunit SecE [Planctomycetota bacterium]